MTDEIRASLKNLKRLAPQLNKVVDDAAQVVREVERFLVDDLKLSIPAEVNVTTYKTDSKNAEELTQLKFCRVNGKFRIAIVKERVTYFDSNADTFKLLEETPWLEASREEKAEAFVELPNLLEAIVTEVEKTIATMGKAKPQVEEILASMK